MILETPLSPEVFVIMSKKRYIDTKFWSDNYIIELAPLEKYLFLYFISNEHTNLCGFYELPLRIMAFETGLDQVALKKMLAKFEKDSKVLYKEGWLIIKNFIKNQVLNPSIVEGIDREMKQIPSSLEWVLNTDWVQSGNRLGTRPYISKVKSSKVNKDDFFEKFWVVYPKKEKKKQSQEIWVRKSLDKKIDIILAFIEKAKESDRWQKGYIKQPTTFLNSESWEDDIAAYNDADRPKSHKL